MSTEKLIILYDSIISVGFFLIFLYCYWFGWYYDKRYRFVTRRIRMSNARKILHHFRGIPRSSPQIHSAICVAFQTTGFFALFDEVLLIGTRFIDQKESKLFYLKLVMGIMLLFMLVTITVMIYHWVMVRKKAAFAQEYFGIKINKYKELDRIFLGVENLGGWTPEKAENSPISKDLPRWFRHVVDLRDIMGVDLHNQTHTVKVPSFNHTESNPVQEIYLDKHDKSGKVQSLARGKITLESTPLLGGDTFVPAINDIGEKYYSVEKTNEFSEEMNIQQGKAALQDMARQALESEFFVQRTSSRNEEDLESLSQGFDELHNKYSIGSAADKIQEQMEGLNPENTFKIAEP